MLRMAAAATAEIEPALDALCLDVAQVPHVEMQRRFLDLPRPFQEAIVRRVCLAHDGHSATVLTLVPNPAVTSDERALVAVCRDLDAADRAEVLYLATLLRQSKRRRSIG